MRADKQRELFPPSQEDSRLETIERLWGDHPKITTAARLFTEQAAREAAQIAQTST